MKKKILLILAAALTAAVLTGCASDVSVYYYPGSDRYAYEIVFCFDDDELAVLDRSARNGEKISGLLPGTESLAGDDWTVELYLTYLLDAKRQIFNGEMPSEYRKLPKVKSNGSTYYGFRYVFENAAGEEEDADAEAEEYELTRGFFFNRYSFTEPNIFNGFKEQYKNAVPGSKRSLTAIDVAAGGWYNQKESGEWEKLMPGFTEAFPDAGKRALFDVEKLRLDYYMITNSKMITSGETETDAEGNRYYRWQTLFTAKDDVIIYELIRANSVGWNVLAIAIGLAVVGFLLLYCRFAPKKDRPVRQTVTQSARGRFPYDPFESDDPFGDYGGPPGKSGPSGGGGDDKNPFGGGY
ncbi:MAG: hypothetical protein LBP26_00630 [Clostridiales bacterium]|jgi:hypothetical protein|nr:hypothetical protein [Clostridiales bacterium]